MKKKRVIAGTIVLAAVVIITDIILSREVVVDTFPQYIYITSDKEKIGFLNLPNDGEAFTSEKEIKYQDQQRKIADNVLDTSDTFSIFFDKKMIAFALKPRPFQSGVINLFTFIAV